MSPIPRPYLKDGEGSEFSPAWNHKSLSACARGFYICQQLQPHASDFLFTDIVDINNGGHTYIGEM